MQDLAIALARAASQEAGRSVQLNRRFNIVVAVTRELMHQTQCSKETAYLAASKALAEVEASSDFYVDVDNTSANGIALMHNGKRIYLSTAELTDLMGIVMQAKNAKIHNPSTTIH